MTLSDDLNAHLRVPAATASVASLSTLCSTNHPALNYGLYALNHSSAGKEMQFLFISTIFRRFPILKGYIFANVFLLTCISPLAKCLSETASAPFLPHPTTPSLALSLLATLQPSFERTVFRGGPRIAVHRSGPFFAFIELDKPEQPLHLARRPGCRVRGRRCRVVCL